MMSYILQGFGAGLGIGTVVAILTMLGYDTEFLTIRHKGRS